MATIPPWLNVQPSDFSGALLKGLQTGLSIAEMRNQTTENQANRQAAWDKAQEAAALAVWERQQQAELEREKLAQDAETQRAQLASTEAYRQGELENRRLANAIDQQQAEAMASHYKNLEDRPVDGMIKDASGNWVRADADSNMPTEVNLDPTKDYVTKNGALVIAKMTPQQVATQKLLQSEEKRVGDELANARQRSVDPLLDENVRRNAWSDIGVLTQQYSDIAGRLTNAPGAVSISANAPTAAATAANPASGYASAEAIKAAWKAGKISRDQAIGLLRSQFGFQ